MLQYNREELATVQLYSGNWGVEAPTSRRTVEVPSNLILGRLDASTKRRYTSARGPGSDQPTVSPTRLTFLSSLLTACRALGRNELPACETYGSPCLNQVFRFGLMSVSNLDTIPFSLQMQELRSSITLHSSPLSCLTIKKS
jgi:hypothetical protein